MGQSVHTGVSHLLCRKGGNQHGIQDGNVRCDLKVCQRILDSLGVICDNGESSYLCGSSGCGGNGAEMRFRAQLREVKGNDQILEGGIRMLFLMELPPETTMAFFPERFFKSSKAPFP